MTGSLRFSYPDPGAETAEPEVTTIDDPTAEPETMKPETAAPRVTKEPPSGSESDLMWVLGFLALALVVTGYFIWRKRST